MITKESYKLRNGLGHETRLGSPRPMFDPAFQPGQVTRNGYQQFGNVAVVHSVTWCPDTVQWIVCVPGYSAGEIQFHLVDEKQSAELIVCSEAARGCIYCSAAVVE